MKNPKNITVFILSIAALLTFPLTGPLHSQPQPQNLIPNGDFEKGSQGFGLTAKNTTEMSANGFLLFKGLDGLNNAAQVLSANALKVQPGERMRLSLRTKREKMPSDGVVLIGGYYYSGDRKVNLGMENVFGLKGDAKDWEKSEKVFLVPQKVGGETPVFFVFYVIAGTSKKTEAEVRVDDILLTREPAKAQSTKVGLEERMKDRVVSPEAFRPSPSHAGFPSPIAEWSEDEKNFQRESARILSEIVGLAIQKGEKELRIPPGDYRFDTAELPGLALDKVTNFTLRAENVQFWFYPFHRVDGILLRNSQNVRITGLTIDYDPVAFPQGKIVELDKTQHTLVFELDPGFTLPDLPSKHRSAKIIPFSPEGELRNVEIDWVEKIDDLGRGRYRVHSRSKRIFWRDGDTTLGDTLVLADRSMRMAINIVSSESVVLENITIYATPHMAITEEGGRGGHAYQNIRVVRRPHTKRMLACNADIFHSLGVERGPRLENCELSWSGDDPVNIHAYLHFVSEQKAPGEFIALFQKSVDLKPGSKAFFHSYEDMREIAFSEVASVEIIKTGDEVSFAEKILVEKKHAFLKPYITARIKLKSDLTLPRHTIFYSEAAMASGAVLRDNYIHDTYARGTCFKSQNGVIENNRFERTSLGGLILECDHFFMEGPPVKNVVIRGNRFVDTARHGIGYGDWTYSVGAITVAAESPIGLPRSIVSKNIQIVSNIVIRPSVAGIFVGSAENVLTHGNQIETPVFKTPNGAGGRMKVPDPYYGIFTAFCKDVKVSENRVEKLIPHTKGEVGNLNP